MARRSELAPYRRRRPLPAVIMVLTLALASVVVWGKVFSHTENSTERSTCVPSVTTPAKLPAITPLPYDALDFVSPLPPAQVQVHTLNASTQVGLAGRIQYELAQYGIGQAGVPGNDPRYPASDMRCFGQIRFGPNGYGAARTLSMLVPCAQLVRDNRQNTSVDLSLGSYFTDVAPSSAATEVLAELTTWAHDHPTSTGGGLQAQAAQPKVTATLLTNAHSWRC